MVMVGYFMKALVVTEALRGTACVENSTLVLLRLAYDLVSAEPNGSVSMLATRVATAAQQQGLILAAPAGSFTFAQMQQVQQQVHVPRPTQRLPPPPCMCWRCGASGHMAGTCTAAVNPSNPYPFKPARA